MSGNRVEEKLVVTREEQRRIIALEYALRAFADGPTTANTILSTADQFEHYVRTGEVPLDTEDIYIRRSK